MAAIGRLLVVFRPISDAASVLDDVDVIVDEASTAFNVTQDSELMYSACCHETREDYKGESTEVNE